MTLEGDRLRRQLSRLPTNNQLDVLPLLLHPVVVGSAQKLFADGPGRLELVEQQPLSTGVVHLLYRPAT
jgi:hypothetical protein